MAVADQQGEPIFLHAILPGGTSHSFGIAVAKLAGMPEEVITNAFKMLEQLEKRGGSPKPFMLNSFQDSIEIPKQVRNDNLILDRLIHKELEQLDISSMTPLQALNKLADLKEKIKVLEKEERIAAD
jgi:DNA mismatch repair protein MutS